MTTALKIALGAITAALLTSPASSQEGTVTADGFLWSDPMASGSWLRIHNYTGPISVGETAGAAVEVRAVQRGDGSLPEVAYEVVRDGQNVTICARPRNGATCDENGVRSRGRSEGWRRGSVEFTVLLPRGVNIRAGTRSGSISVQDAGADVVASSGSGSIRTAMISGSVEATTGSGTIEVSEVGGPVTARTGSGRVLVATARGPVNARTGSGSIDVRMLTVRLAEDMQFSTGSGGITLHLPNDFQGEIDARTGSGGISTDFPLTIQGRMDRGRLRGTIGGGGSTVGLSTGSGRIELLRLP